VSCPTQTFLFLAAIVDLATSSNLYSLLNRRHGGSRVHFAAGDPEGKSERVTGEHLEGYHQYLPATSGTALKLERVDMSTTATIVMTSKTAHA